MQLFGLSTNQLHRLDKQIARDAELLVEPLDHGK
jgi:hypothetical protein